MGSGNGSSMAWMRRFHSMAGWVDQVSGVPQRGRARIRGVEVEVLLGDTQGEVGIDEGDEEGPGGPEGEPGVLVQPPLRLGLPRS